MDRKSGEENSSSTTNIKAVLRVAIVIAFLFIIAFICIFHSQHLSYKISDWGNFGDYIGGVFGAIFASLSALLVYYTFKEQSKSTEKQMILNRNQMFESSFFELLKVQRELFDKVDESNLSEIIRSTSFFFGDTLINNREDCISQIHRHYELKFSGMVNADFSSIYTGVNHCFRHLYYVIKLVEDNNNLTPKEKNNYYCFIESQMNNIQLLATMINVVWYSKKSNNYDYLHFLDETSFLENVVFESALLESLKENIFTNTRWDKSH